jgi:glycogen debranching enzyme
LVKGTYGEKFGRINDFEALNRVMNLWIMKVFPELKMWQFYVVDVKAATKHFKETWKNGRGGKDIYGAKGRNLEERAAILQDVALGYAKNDGSRFDKSIDVEKACAFISGIIKDGDDATILFGKLVDEINLGFYKEFDIDTSVINDQIMARYIQLYLIR